MNNTCLKVSCPLVPGTSFLQEYWNEDWRSVIVNISGKEFRTRLRHLRRYPTSRLGKIAMAKTKAEVAELCDGFIPGSPPVIFFFRNPTNFQVILDVYRSREMHISETSCPLTAEAEFEFWGLGEIFLQPCCAIKYFPKTVSAHIEKHEVSSVDYISPECLN